MYSLVQDRLRAGLALNAAINGVINAVFIVEGEWNTVSCLQ